MALEFMCKSCGRRIVVQFLKPGEHARCRACGADNSVPADAQETTDIPKYHKDPLKKPCDIVEVEVPVRLHRPFPGLIQTGQLLFYFVGITFAIMFFVTLIGFITKYETHKDNVIINAVSSAAMIFVLLIGFHKTRASSREVFPLATFNWHVVLLFLGVALGTRLIFTGFGTLLVMLSSQINETMKSWTEQIFKIYEMGPGFSFLFIVIIGPVIEELLFRGLILRGYEKRYGSSKAILYSSVIFGIIHINPGLVVWGFLLGYVTAWAFIFTRSLIPCIIIHSFSNLISYGSFYAFAHISGNSNSGFSLTDTLIILILLCVGFFLVLGGYQRLKQLYGKKIDNSG